MFADQSWWSGIGTPACEGPGLIHQPHPHGGRGTFVEKHLLKIFGQISVSMTMKSFGFSLAKKLLINGFTSYGIYIWWTFL